MYQYEKNNSRLLELNRINSKDFLKEEKNKEEVINSDSVIKMMDVKQVESISMNDIKDKNFIISIILLLGGQGLLFVLVKLFQSNYHVFKLFLIECFHSNINIGRNKIQSRVQYHEVVSR